MASEQKWSARWVRFGVVVMLILATIGAWEVVKMVRLGSPAHADGLVADHLTCYDVKSRGNNSGAIDARALVQLRDQFFVTGGQDAAPLGIGYPGSRHGRATISNRALREIRSARPVSGVDPKCSLICGEPRAAPLRRSLRHSAGNCSSPTAAAPCRPYRLEPRVVWRRRCAIPVH